MRFASSMRALVVVSIVALASPLQRKTYASSGRPRTPRRMLHHLKHMTGMPDHPKSTTRALDDGADLPRNVLDLTPTEQFHLVRQSFRERTILSSIYAAAIAGSLTSIAMESHTHLQRKMRQLELLNYEFISPDTLESILSATNITLGVGLAFFGLCLFVKLQNDLIELNNIRDVLDPKGVKSIQLWSATRDQGDRRHIKQRMLQLIQDAQRTEESSASNEQESALYRLIAKVMVYANSQDPKQEELSWLNDSPEWKHVGYWRQQAKAFHRQNISERITNRGKLIRNLINELSAQKRLLSVLYSSEGQKYIPKTLRGYHLLRPLDRAMAALHSENVIEERFIEEQLSALLRDLLARDHLSSSETTIFNEQELAVVNLQYLLDTIYDKLFSIGANVAMERAESRRLDHNLFDPAASVDTAVNTAETSQIVFDAMNNMDMHSQIYEVRNLIREQLIYAYDQLEKQDRGISSLSNDGEWKKIVAAQIANEPQTTIHLNSWQTRVETIRRALEPFREQIRNRFDALNTSDNQDEYESRCLEAVETMTIDHGIPKDIAMTHVLNHLGKKY